MRAGLGVLLLIGCGALGYLMRKVALDPAPLVLGLVISPIFEMSLRQSLIMSNGNYLIFFGRPISLGLLLISTILLAMSAFAFMLKRKDWRTKLAEAEARKAQTRQMGDQITELDKRAKEAISALESLMLRIPNLPHASVPAVTSACPIE